MRIIGYEDLPFGLKIGESDVRKELGISTSRYSREQDPSKRKVLVDLSWSICKKPHLLEHKDPLVSTILHRRLRLYQIAKSQEGLLHTKIMIDISPRKKP
jgi:hypothetical protein